MTKEVKTKYGNLPQKVAIEQFIKDNIRGIQAEKLPEVSEKVKSEFNLRESEATNLTKYYYFHAKN